MCTFFDGGELYPQVIHRNGRGTFARGHRGNAVCSPQCERRAVCERLPWPEKLLYLTGNGGYWFLIIARRIIFIPLYVSKDECVHDFGSS